MNESGSRVFGTAGIDSVVGVVKYLRLHSALPPMPPLGGGASDDESTTGAEVFAACYKLSAPERCVSRLRLSVVVR